MITYPKSTVVLFIYFHACRSHNNISIIMMFTLAPTNSCITLLYCCAHCSAVLCAGVCLGLQRLWTDRFRRTHCKQSDITDRSPWRTWLRHITMINPPIHARMFVYTQKLMYNLFPMSNDICTCLHCKVATLQEHLVSPASPFTRGEEGLGLGLGLRTPTSVFVA